MAATTMIDGRALYLLPLWPNPHTRAGHRRGSRRTTNVRDGVCREGGVPARGQRFPTLFPFFITYAHAWLASLLSNFLMEVLESYDIQMAYHIINTVWMLAIFTHPYEAFIGITPSVHQLHRHFVMRQSCSCYLQLRLGVEARYILHHINSQQNS